MKVNIRKGEKKATVGLLPPPICLTQPESKNGFALAPPPRPSLAKRTMLADDSDGFEATYAKNTEFVPSFANLFDVMIDKAPAPDIGFNTKRQNHLIFSQR